MSQIIMKMIVVQTQTYKIISWQDIAIAAKFWWGFRLNSIMNSDLVSVY